MRLIFINPHQNHLLSDTYLNSIFAKNLKSKAKAQQFIHDFKGKYRLTALVIPEVFHDAVNTFNTSSIIRNLALSHWQKENSSEIIKLQDINKIMKDDIIALTTKDLKYKTLIQILRRTNCKVAFIIDDHIWSSYHSMEKVIQEIGIERSILWSQISLKDNPYYCNFNLVKTINEEVFGWRNVNTRFKCINSLEKRKKRAIATGCLTYRIFKENITKELLENNISCIHPGREYLLNMHHYSKKVDCCSPVRDYRYGKKNGLLLSFSKLKNRFESAKYYNLNMPKIFNQYLFTLCPSVFNGFPNQSIQEAMCSGSIIIGTNKFEYKSLGLVSDYNYLSIGDEYDIKKIDDLINFYSKRLDLLKDIQENSLKTSEKFRKN